MLANAVGPELLKHGKKWYFLTADYAFGTDAYARLKKILLAQGGQEVGNDLHDINQTDYSSYLTKARNTDANVLVFCNYGPNTQNATKNAVQLGLNKKMTFGGILCGNDVAVGMPVDDLVGSVWGYVWGPEAGGDAKRVYNALKPGVSAVDWRQYLGYQAGRNLINRIEHAGTTDTEKLIEAFENYHYDADKKSRRVLPQVRPSSDPADLRRPDRREQQAHEPGRVLRDRVDRRRRVRGGELQESR